MKRWLFASFFSAATLSCVIAAPVFDVGTDSSLFDVRVRRESGCPFVFIDFAPRSDAADHVLSTATLPPIRVNCAFKTKPVMQGAWGLRPLAAGRPSATYLAIAEPHSRHGVVCGYLTNLKACGAIDLAIEADGAILLKPVVDYGRMLVRKGAAQVTETIVVGEFADCRLGLERYADEVARRFDIHLPSNRSGATTWCFDRFGYSDRSRFPDGCGAGTAESARLYADAAAALRPYGFDFYQIDDQWQDGSEAINGPARLYDHCRKDGPFPDGFARTVKYLNDRGMTAGLWFIPFGGQEREPGWKYGDIFVKSAKDIPRAAHSAYKRPLPYPKRRGETCRSVWNGDPIDFSKPAGRDYLAGLVKKFTFDWGFRYLKCDGISGGFAADLYGGEEWMDQGFANAVFSDPTFSNVENYRRGFETVRAAAAPGTFILACNLGTIRAMAPSFGLVDGMRIGNDNGPIDQFPQRRLLGQRAGTARYFFNGRVWRADPDSVYVRKAVPYTRAKSMASWVWLTDSLYECGDWLPDLPEERVEILRRTLGHHGSLNVRPIDFFENEFPNAWYLELKKDEPIVAVFNWATNETLKVDYDFAYAGLVPGAVYEGTEMWSGEPISVAGDRFSVSVPPDDCRIYRLKRKSVWRHDQPVRISSPAGVREWAPENFPVMEGNLRLTFEAREFEPAPGTKKSGHWGVAYTNFRGENGYVFSHGAGLHYVLSSALGKSLHGDDCEGRQPTVKIPHGENGATNGWTRFVVESTPESFLATVDGDICRSERSTMLPFRGFRFRAYNRDIEIRNVRLENYEPKPVRKVGRPIVAVKGKVPDGETPLAEEPVSPEVGGVMFWAKFRPGTDCVKMLGADGRVKARFYCCGDYRIQADVAMRGTDRPLIYKRRLLDETTRARDDFHYAFTWREDGNVRFFLNGIPFDVGLGGDDYKKPISGNDLAGVAKIVVGDARMRGRADGQEVSDLYVYHRVITNREVMDAYRARMPIDMVLQDSVLKAGEPDVLRLAVAPGGTYRLPMPIEDYPLVKGTVDVSARMERVIAEKLPHGGVRRAYEPVAGGECSFSNVAVAAKRELALPAVALSRGEYRLLVSVARPGGVEYLRTLNFSALPDAKLPPVKPSKEKWKKGALLWERTFRNVADAPFGQGETHPATTKAGSYLEVGAKGGLEGDRMACIVDFPESAKGRPCLLEIVWPDDRERVMGLYMYLDSPKTSQLRDRLMGGVVADESMKRTGHLQTAEYLFFPSSTNHLFEARTMVTDRPAAIAALRVWRIAEPFPVLEIRRPKGLPARRFGHTDEDQTFDYLLNDQYAHGMDEKLTELFRYFAYTGQSAFDYNIWRYTSTFGAKEMHWALCGFAGGQGQFPYMCRQFNRADVSLAGGMFLFSEPHIARRDETDFAPGGEDYLWLDDEGRNTRGMFLRDGTANMAHPKVRRMMQSYCEDLIVESAARGLGAVKIYTDMLGKWPNLKTGYDDWTWARFLHDTGVRPPNGMPARAVGALDYHARYEYLTATNTPAVREKWLRWRADVATDYFRQLVAFIREKAPKLEIRLMLPTGRENDYVEYGLDVRALAAIEGVKLGYERGYTGYWQHWFHSNKRPAEDYSAIYAPAKIAAAVAIRGAQRSARVCCSGAAYFESFRPSPLNDRFKTYFQSADVKPWGRNFLREPAFMVGIFDCLDYQVGGQPLGTLGREDETREFTQAFCALPALPFDDLPLGEKAPPDVVARSLRTGNGVYYYLVNLSAEACSASLPEASLEDLSSGETVSGARIALRPYELRSFLRRSARGAVDD